MTGSARGAGRAARVAQICCRASTRTASSRRPGARSRKSTALLEMIDDSYLEGLDPNDYHAAALRAVRELADRSRCPGADASAPTSICC